jgi:hypothetical protein
LFCIGGSVYEVFGGGASVCVNGDGVSVCEEVGLGFGANAEIDVAGDLAEAGNSVLAEASAAAGPLSATAGVELDNCGNLKTSASAELDFPGVHVGIDQKLDPSVRFAPDIHGATALVESERGLTVQGKVAARFCQRF